MSISFHVLPKEIKLFIFQNCDASILLKIKAVCKQWALLLNDESLWLLKTDELIHQNPYLGKIRCSQKTSKERYLELRRQLKWLEHLIMKSVNCKSSNFSYDIFLLR